MGSPPKRTLSKFKVFNFLSWKQGVFVVSKYKRKIKFDQSLGYRNGSFPLKWGRENSSFLISDARHMNFSA